MKSLPAGTACAANVSLPISESSFRFVVLLRDCHLVSSSRISLSLSGGKHICCETESNSRPRKGGLLLGHQLCPWQLGTLEACTLSGSIAGAHRSCESGAPTMR